MKRYRFLIYIIIVFVLVDAVVSTLDPVGRLDLFVKNDFEKIVIENSTNDFNKILYGNSAVISAYIEGQSDSGYTNFGLDYGTVEDLQKILYKGLISVESDIVLALNYFTLLDTLETNETYPWHRKIYQPYVYFQRDRLSEFITGNIETLLAHKRLSDYRHDLQRSVYNGLLSREELWEKAEGFEERYFSQGIGAHAKNLVALKKVIDFCAGEGIRLRIVWMPWNPAVEIPGIVKELMEKTNEILGENGTESYDITHLLPLEHFHDIGHLNYEIGAPFFTKEVEPWLAKN